MDRIIRDITEKLLDRNPPEKEFLHLHELRKFNIPDFIVDRIEFEIRRKLEESVVRSESEWVDFGNPEVMKARKIFVDTLLREARLPASQAHELYETAVRDTLAVLIRPRKNIPDMIYGSNQALTVDRLEQETESIFVFRHLAVAPVRYARRKGLPDLTLEQCRNVIQKVDSKLAEKYNVLNWTQLLDPLFSLLDNQLDTDLLRMFFEDKQRNRIARQFDLMESPLSRSEFIEVLSSPDRLGLDEEDEDQTTLFDTGRKRPGSGIEQKPDKKPETEQPLSPVNRGPDEDKLQDEKEETEDPQPVNTMFTQFEQTQVEETEEEPEDTEVDIEIEVREEQNTDHEEEEAETPLYNRFKFDIDSEVILENPDSEADEQTEDSFNRLFAEEDEDVLEETGTAGSEEPDAGSTNGEKERKLHEVEVEQSGQRESGEEEQVFEEVNEVDSEGVHDATGEDDKDIDVEEDPAIWQNFVPEEERSESNETEEEEYLEEPIIDLVNEGQEDDEDEQARLLTEWMSGDEERFVEEIFTGSWSAYEETLAVLATFDDWKSATRYIEEDVFGRNHVDMYEEAAVDFTDRLHVYFRKSKSP